jgi:hypothetical protein
MKLYDATGKQVAQKTFTASQGVNHIQFSDRKHLAKGTYLLEVIIQGKRFTRKLVKK